MGAVLGAPARIKQRAGRNRLQRKCSSESRFARHVQPSHLRHHSADASAAHIESSPISTRSFFLIFFMQSNDGHANSRLWPDEYPVPELLALAEQPHRL